MKSRVGINGFGRVGRCFFRATLDDEEIDCVAINDVAKIGTLAHLLTYDSVHGRLRREVEVAGDTLRVGKREVRVLHCPDPADLRWGGMGIDVVIESSGVWTRRDGADRHLTAEARRVIVTAPMRDADINIVMGVNQDDYDPARHSVISSSSCLANCVAPVVSVLHKRFGVVKGMIFAAHAYAGDQRLLDLAHADPRRGRAAALSMVPSTTGAAVGVSQVLPELEGRLDAAEVRVPIPDVSLADVTVLLAKEVGVEEVNGALEEAAAGELRGILAVSREPLVSVDFRGDPHSSVVDAALTRVVEGNLVKVLSWYDNEWGYGCRLGDLIKHFAGRG